ncbi:MAG: 2Fe-2S iron-sulfur cluster binding domain-containing protein [SAR202 cluster bacterium]|nr:2Fe-2S iron-sulfur cluster binding domain-containing protein [SAR202 cluster bacterium]
MPDNYSLTIDGVQITAKPGQTVIQAAMDAGIYVPYLCYWPGMKPYGACRMCVVEVEGQRGTPASCTLPAADGMVVNSVTPQVDQLREGILELLLSEHPHGCLTCHRIELCGPQDICLRHVRVTDRCVVCPKNERCELKDTVRYVNMNLETPLAYNYRNLPVETKDPFYDRDYNLCIVCARCVRACDEIRGDEAIAMVDRSGTALVGTSRGSSLLESGCEFCGSCIDVCPVGALVESKYKWEKAVETITSTCTHCPVGCQVDLEVDARGRVIRSLGNWTAPANKGQLCFKGKFGMDFMNHRNRLKSPLIRKHGVLEETTWEEALDLLTDRLPDYAGGKYALLINPRATTENAYLAQKFARQVMNTNNVDVVSNTTPSLLKVLGKSLGTPASTGTIQELDQAQTVVIVNNNTTEDHNIVALPIKQGVKAGSLQLIIIDPREVELTRHAAIWLRPYPGTESALIASLLNVILEEGLHNKQFIRENSEGWESIENVIGTFNPSYVGDITGVPADQIVAAARLIGQRDPAAFVYGLDNVPDQQQDDVVQGLVNLALATGNIGKPGSGLFPMFKGANHQGAWDVGCNPDFLPGHRAIDAVDNSQNKHGHVPNSEGLGTNQIFQAILDGEITAIHIVGDDPSIDDFALHAISKAEIVVVHEMFPSKLTELADIVLPLPAFSEQAGTYTSVDRRIQAVRQVIPPKGEAQPLHWVLREIATRMNIDGFAFTDSAEILNEIASLVPTYGGITYQRVQSTTGGLQWPCPSINHPGTSTLYSDGFSTDEKAKVVAPREHAIPAISQDFPLLFVPGRVLVKPNEDITIMEIQGHNQIVNEDILELNADDAHGLGVSDGELLELITPVNRKLYRAKLNGGLSGIVTSTTLFGELATKLDTSEEFDPMLRVPRLDVIPARVSKPAPDPQTT